MGTYHKRHILSLDPVLRRIGCLSNVSRKRLYDAYMEVTHHGTIKETGSVLKAIVLAGEGRLLEKYLDSTQFTVSLTKSTKPMCVCVGGEVLLSLRIGEKGPTVALLLSLAVSPSDVVKFLTDSLEGLSMYRGAEKCVSQIVSSVIEARKMDWWATLTIAQQCSLGNSSILRHVTFPSKMYKQSADDLEEVYRVARSLLGASELTPGAAMFAYKLASYLLNWTEYGFRNENEIETLEALMHRCLGDNSLVIKNGHVIPVHDMSHKEIMAHPDHLVRKAAMAQECKLARLKYHYGINPRSLSGIHTDFVLRALDEDMLDMGLIVASERAGPNDEWFQLFLDLLASGADTTYIDGKAVRNVLASEARHDLVAAIIDLLEEDFLTNQAIIEHLRGVPDHIDGLLTKRMEKLLL